MCNIKKNDSAVVNNAEELLIALKQKQSCIVISEHFKDEFLKNTQLPLSQVEEMGFELGFSGTANLISTPLFHIINWLSKDSKQQKKIDSSIRKYTLKKEGNALVLSLKQLDY